ncbi:hypothetical protein AB6A40_008971 [Gnathostoma spinigerum]|uniref:Vitellogenin n=1 Tax=Gnathostoma spinigerum TaxID=75299 RepID=A0ABD6EZN8_9BILA
MVSRYLRRSVGDGYVVTVRPDETNNGDGNTLNEKCKTVILTLTPECDETQIIAQKTFPWPEAELPNEITYDENGSILSLKGDATIANIPFNRSKICYARIGSVSHKSEPLIYSSFSSHTAMEISPVMAALNGIIYNENVEKNWVKLLDMILKTDHDKYARVTLSPHEQEKLVNFISVGQRDLDDQVTVISWLSKHNVLSAPR